MTITDATRRAFHEVDAILPAGYRTQLVDGEIIVSPAPLGVHEYVFARLTAQLVRKSAEGIGVSGTYGIETPFGNYIPDVTVVADVEAILDKPSWGDPGGIVLVAEITSTNADTDREGKRRAYAAAGIPLYLLVDRKVCESILFSEPDVVAQDYRALIRVPFGSDLELPAPFSFTLTDFTPPER